MPLRGRGLLVTGGCCLGMVLLLMAIEQATTPPWDLDRRLLATLAAGRCPPLDRFFAAVTWAGSLSVLAPVTLAMIVLWTRDAGERLLLGLGLGGSSTIAALAKQAFARTRPELFPGPVPLPEDPSFPSSHAAQIVAMLGAILVVLRDRGRLRGRGLLLIPALLLVGATVLVSRAYLQVHYPSDVAGGLVVGGCWIVALAGAVAACTAQEEKGNAQ